MAANTTPPQLFDAVDEKVAGAKAAVALGGAGLYGLTLSEWVAALTIAYILLQIGLLVPKYLAMFSEFYKRWRQ